MIEQVPAEPEKCGAPEKISASEFIVALLVGEGIIKPDDALRAVEIIEAERMAWLSRDEPEPLDEEPLKD